MARLDSELVARGIARSRQNAKEMILSGGVTVNGKAVTKPSAEVFTDDEICSSCEELYVGRGAVKLEKAAKEFAIDLTGKKCIDVGASTGGFTDFMLKNGAAEVCAADVGHGQLAQSLREDSRVINLEGMDIRDLTEECAGGKADIITADVSFISLRFILPEIFRLLKDDGCAVALIKPQFEAGRGSIGKHGIVRDRKVHERVLNEVDSYAASVGFSLRRYTYSPIKGGSGNIEYLAYFRKNGDTLQINDFHRLVGEAFGSL